MNIVVPIKNVIDVELNLRVSGGQLDQSGLTYVMNRWDENAVEAAVSLSEQHDGHTTAISIGNGGTAETLRKALAMGIAEAIHVEADQPLDASATATILHSVAKELAFDLIICGKQSQDTDMGSTGACLAHALGVAYVPNVLEIEALSAKQLRVKRLGDGGQELIEIDLPAVITASDSLNEPRLASLRGIMQAKKKPFQTKSLSDIGLSTTDLAPRIVVEGYSEQSQREAGQKIDGEPEEVAAAAVSWLFEKAKVLA